MIATLEGNITAIHLTSVILNVHGVGYQVHLTARDIDKIKLNQTTKYFIYEHIREDSHDLYGFSNPDDKQSFEQLLSVNGVGPKVALAITSSVHNLSEAIGSGNTSALQSVSGVGKRVAERIVVDLKNKVGAGSNVLSRAEANSPVYEALVQLGYPSSQSHEVIARMPIDLSGDEEKIKWALKELGK